MFPLVAFALVDIPIARPHPSNPHPQPPPPVVYVPALKQGPVTVGSEVLMQEALLLHLYLAMLLVGSSPNLFFLCAASARST